MRLYAIKDDIVGFTGAIMTAYNDEQVIRMMDATVNADDGNQMTMWPKDFSAWYVGDLDKVDGHLTEIQPQLICRGDSLIRRRESNEVRDSVPAGEKE